MASSEAAAGMGSMKRASQLAAILNKGERTERNPQIFKANGWQVSQFGILLFDSHLGSLYSTR